MVLITVFNIDFRKRRKSWRRFASPECAHSFQLILSFLLFCTVICLVVCEICSWENCTNGYQDGLLWATHSWCIQHLNMALASALSLVRWQVMNQHSSSLKRTSQK